MEDRIKRNITGEWRDICKHKDGTTDVGAWQHNIIVDSIGLLIASLMKGVGTGITHWAVGSGNPDWDSVYPSISQDPAVNHLVNEIGRKQVDSIEFIDENNQVAYYATNRILVTCVFSINDCLGNWREFGLFGGNASMEEDTGIMIDHKIHKYREKTDDVEITRQIRFIFN